MPSHTPIIFPPGVNRSLPLGIKEENRSGHEAGRITPCFCPKPAWLCHIHLYGSSFHFSAIQVLRASSVFISTKAEPRDRSAILSIITVTDSTARRSGKVFQSRAGKVIRQAVNEEPFRHVHLDSRPDSDASFVYPRTPLVAIRTLSR